MENKKPAHEVILRWMEWHIAYKIEQEVDWENQIVLAENHGRFRIMTKILEEIFIPEECLEEVIDRLRTIGGTNHPMVQEEIGNIVFLIHRLYSSS